MQPTAEPIFIGTDNADLLNWALDLQDAVRACNADKVTLWEINNGFKDAESAPE